MALAAVPQSGAPVPGGLGPEGSDGLAVAGHRVVGEVTAHHACQPLPLVGDGSMPASLELVLDLSELGPHPLGGCDALEHEPPGLGLRADVREAQEVERFRLPDAPCLPALDGEPAELD